MRTSFLAFFVTLVSVLMPPALLAPFFRRLFSAKAALLLPAVAPIPTSSACEAALISHLLAGEVSSEVKIAGIGAGRMVAEGMVELDLSLPELSTGFGLPLAVDPIIHPVG